MTDYFALFGEARRAWLDPAELKQKYFELSRAAPPDAATNEAFQVLSDPKLRLQHLLALHGVDLTAGRPVPREIADLTWEMGKLFQEIDRWLEKSAKAGSALARALLAPERATLEERLARLETKLDTGFDSVLQRLEETGSSLPNDIANLIASYDSISYLTRLREQAKEKRLQLSLG